MPAGKTKAENAVTNPVMGSYDGIFVNAYKYAPFSPDRLTSQKGFDAAEDMLTYAACRANFNLKRYAVLADGWQIVPAVTDPLDTRHAQAKAYADFTAWCLNNIVSPSGMTQDFRAVLFAILRAAWDGFHVSEIGYRYLTEGPFKGRIGYAGFYAKPARQIDFNLDPQTLQVEYLTSYTPGTGYDFEVPVDKCVLYTHNPNGGLPHGMGDWRACYKHWFSGDNLTRFLSMALERWGAPVLIAQYPAGNTRAMQDAQQALDSIRQGAAPVLPENVKYELVSVVSQVFDGFLHSIRYHNEQIAVNIQCSTLTTGAGQNSLALGEVHQDTAQTVYDFLRRDLEGVVNAQIIRRLCLLNFADCDLSLLPRLQLGSQESADRLKLTQMFDLLIQNGVIWKRAKYIREELGLPPLDPDEKKGLAAEAQARQEAHSRLADARNSAQIGAHERRPDRTRAKPPDRRAEPQEGMNCERNLPRMKRMKQIGTDVSKIIRVDPFYPFHPR